MILYDHSKTKKNSISLIAVMSLPGIIYNKFN